MRRSQGPSLGMAAVASSMGDFISMPAPRASQPEQLKSWLRELRIDPSMIMAQAYADRPEGRLWRLSLRDEKGPVELLVIPNVTRLEGVEPIGGDMYAGQISGSNCVTWPDRGCALLVIGDRSIDQLKQFALGLYR